MLSPRLTFASPARYLFTAPQTPSKLCSRTNIQCCTLGRTLVVGASRGVGLHVTKALSEDSSATAIVALRSMESRKLLEEIRDYNVVTFDARDRETVLAKIDSIRPDTVISCFGGTMIEPDLPDYSGNLNLIDASVQTGVKRFVLLSALGAGDSENSVPFQVVDAMRRVLKAKSLAELYLKESSLEWTIVRPGPLSDDPPSGHGILTEDSKYYGTISRAEVANLLLQAAVSKLTFRKILSALDRNRLLITRPYVRPFEFWEQPQLEEFCC